MDIHMQDQEWMEFALKLAERAMQQDEVPVGAILVHNGEVIGEGWNQPISHQDPTSHAEIVALREGAKRLKNYRLLDTELYVTLEPCTMCVGAMLHARVKRLVFGALDPKAGAICSVFQILDDPSLNHRIEWRSGVLKDRCGLVLKDFFRKKRIKTQ